MLLRLDGAMPAARAPRAGAPTKPFNRWTPPPATFGGQLQTPRAHLPRAAWPPLVHAGQSIAEKLAAAAAEAKAQGVGATPVKTVTVVEPADSAAGGDAAAADGGGAAAVTATAGSGLNAASVLGGGSAPVPSPPPPAPPAPPGVVVLPPGDVDNTMQSYSVDSAATLESAVAAAGARVCTAPCTTITVTKDIVLGATLRVNSSLILMGACAPEPCKLDGGGDKQARAGVGYFGCLPAARRRAWLCAGVP